MTSALCKVLSYRNGPDRHYVKVKKWIAQFAVKHRPELLAATDAFRCGGNVPPAVECNRRCLSMAVCQLRKHDPYPLRL